MSKSVVSGSNLIPKESLDWRKDDGNTVVGRNLYYPVVDSVIFKASSVSDCIRGPHTPDG